MKPEFHYCRIQASPAIALNNDGETPTVVIKGNSAEELLENMRTYVSEVENVLKNVENYVVEQERSRYDLEF